MMRSKGLLSAFMITFAIANSSQAEESNEWAWQPITEQSYTNPDPQGDSFAESTNLDVFNNNNTAFEEVIDNILISGRQGRNIEGLDAVYSDPSVRQAINSGDDTQARNIIKDKLCDLGLMECDEERRPYLAPEDLIYAQPVAINPIGRPVASIPVRPPKAYGSPKPVPIPRKPHNGPPRKVGYGGPYKPGFPPNKFGPPGGPGLYGNAPLETSYGGGNYADIPNDFYSKPPGVFNSAPIYGGAPGNNFGEGPAYGGGSFFAGSPAASQSPYEFETTPVKQFGNTPATSGLDPIQQHVHHHYHHGEKEKTVIVKPIPVGTPSNGYNEYKENILNDGGFSPVSSGFGTISGSAQLGFTGQKPVYESQQPNLSAGVYKGSDNHPQAQSGLFGNTGYGNGDYQNVQNPHNFYKKELNTAGFNANNIGPSGLSGTTVYNRYQSIDANNVADCVCVPYDQCPNQDFGRKDDLYLPIDPRNIKSDIEALPEDKVVITDGNGTMTVVRIAKSIENGTDDEIEAEATQEIKKISKRETGDKDEEKQESEIQPRLILGSGGNGGAGSDKRVQPTFGISFGLPQGGYGGYPLNPFGPNPVVNPYGPAINGGGLNLGLISVNPLVALQVTKDDYGEKVVKPLINLHVTPNEHFVNKIGQLFHEKKQYLFNKHEHYHHHKFPHPPQHYGGYPNVYAPNHFSYNPQYQEPLYPSYPQVGSFDSYRNEDDYDYGDDDYQGNYDNDAVDFNNFNGYGYGRSLNASDRARSLKLPNDNNKYAKDYSYSPNAAGSPTGASRNNGNKVRFPSDRRRRYTPEQTISQTREKRQAFYGGQQNQNRCGPRQVCCKRNANLQKPNNRGQCGTRHSQGINGRIKTPAYEDGDSEFGEYPWQAAILKKDPKESVYVCGGTLIDHYHILTAAHCVKSYNGFDLRVRLGEWDVNHDVEFYPYVERNVVSVHIHPQYYAGTLDNDIAIIKMEQAVDWTKYPHISPACLPDKFTDYSGQRCWTTGWGKDAFGDFGKYQNILKEVDIPVIAHQQCEAQLRQTRLGYNYQLNPGFVCAGGEEGKDSCKGDGGGPMVCERGGTWQIVGIVSWGIGCGQVNVPGVYVKVAHYLDWIAQVTGRFG